MWYRFFAVDLSRLFAIWKHSSAFVHLPLSILQQQQLQHRIGSSNNCPIKWKVLAVQTLDHFSSDLWTGVGIKWSLHSQWRVVPTTYEGRRRSVWPDWAIFWSLGNFLKPWAAINLPKSPTFLCNFCKGVKIYHFSSEIIFGQLL